MKNWNILAIVVCALALGLFIIPLFGEVNQLQLKNEELVKKLEEKKKEKEELLKLRSNIANLNIKKNIPANPEQENLIRDILKITNKSEFSFDSLAFSLGQHSQINAPQISMNLSVEGQRNKVKNLLSYIEQNERFFGMDNLSFQSKGKNKKNAGLSLNIYALYQE